MVSNIFCSQPYLGKWSNLTSMCFKWAGSTIQLVAGFEGWFLGHCRKAVGWIGSVPSIDVDGKPTQRWGVLGEFSHFERRFLKGFCSVQKKRSLQTLNYVSWICFCWCFFYGFHHGIHHHWEFSRHLGGCFLWILSKHRRSKSKEFFGEAVESFTGQSYE